MARESALRVARPGDATAIEQLIERSVRELFADFYDPAQIERSLVEVYALDPQLIEDATYFVIEGSDRLAAAGGWSFRRTPFGTTATGAVRDRGRRIPGEEPAVIRAFFVHPDHVRTGLGRRLVDAAERAASAAGFDACELTSTEYGVPFYTRMGYAAAETIDFPLHGAAPLRFTRMIRRLD